MVRGPRRFLRRFLPVFSACRRGGLNLVGHETHEKSYYCATCACRLFLTRNTYATAALAEFFSALSGQGNPPDYTSDGNVAIHAAKALRKAVPYDLWSVAPAVFSDFSLFSARTEGRS